MDMDHGSMGNDTMDMGGGMDMGNNSTASMDMGMGGCKISMLWNWYGVLKRVPKGLS